MPTYRYICEECGHETSVSQSISAYSDPARKVTPTCGTHGPMVRRLEVVPGHALANSLAGDRHYDGLRATDGTDISTRTKHREYMKSRGLTTADDFTDTWKKAEKEREALRTGTLKDPELRNTIAEKVYRSL